MMDKNKLLYCQKSTFERISKEEKQKSNSYCEEYKAYLDAAKTEREACREAVRLAKLAGFTEFDVSKSYKTGDKVYCINRSKALVLAVIGKKPMSEGINIAAAHIDSPRLDLKQIPLYEDNEMAFFKTHYYGGIKKYQWVTIPLEIHGVVGLKDGSVVEVCIGKEPSDPVFVITDLLPHLSADQNKKTLAEGIAAEQLNIFIGSEPADIDSDKVRYNVMSLLNDKYGITEEDFISAELEAVPAFTARDSGLDRSFIASYGHDDRVCAFAELKAIMEVDSIDRTAICILADKEEVGSMGVSGMKSAEFEWFIKKLCKNDGSDFDDCMRKSFCLSADVTNAFDPTYPEVSEKRNAAKANYGVALAKFTGSRGKSGSSDASAEVVGEMRRIFDSNEVVWQMAELGKVDQGGGGTVAMYMADRNIDTIDAGVPVLSMHAPYEMVSKLDCYMTYKAVKALYIER